MKYFYLLSAGALVSIVHLFLVWHHRGNRKSSLSEHAVIDRRSHLLYFATHIFTEVFFVLFSYQFYVIEHHLYLPHYLNICFAVFDFVQATLPSKGRTEKIHFSAAYLSWVSYLMAGLVALIKIPLTEPYFVFAVLLLAPILGMFGYMHVKRSNLYPYQVAIVPLFVLYMLVVTIGAS